MSVPAGFTARVATLEDAPGVAALMNAFEQAHVEEPDVLTASDVAGWWRVQLAADSVLVESGDGLAAVALVLERGEERLELHASVL